MPYPATWTQGTSWHQAQFRSWQLEHMEVSHRPKPSHGGHAATRAIKKVSTFDQSMLVYPRVCHCPSEPGNQTLNFTILKQGKAQAGYRKKGTKSFLASEHWEFRMWWNAEKFNIQWAFPLTADANVYMQGQSPVLLSTWCLLIN